MDLWSDLSTGFAVALTPANIGLVLLGVSVGTIVGMLPGIGPVNGIAMLIPMTFALELPPASALILFAGIYYGSQYGNSISTILLNVPGTPSAIVTAIDGYALTRQGRAGPALAMAAIASFVGGTVSLLGLIFLGPTLSAWAIRFGPAEYFALMVFALSTISTVVGKNRVKSLVSVTLGLMMGTVGFDPASAVPRFTFSSMKLLDGLDFVVVAIGFFAISELLLAVERTEAGAMGAARVGRLMLSLRELLDSAWTMVRATVVGFLVGVLPGAGGTIASFVAYSTEKRVSAHGKWFGTGDLRGVAAPEAANNAAANGAMIPMLTLGVPGSATTAVMLGALLSMNVAPGPLFLDSNPEVFWGLIASMCIGNLALLVLNLPLVRLFVGIVTLPAWILMPAIAAVSCVAVYAVNNSAFDLFVMAGFGLLGYLMCKLDFPLAPVIMGLVLGPLMETNLRRALSLSDGSLAGLFASPLAIAIWVMAALVLMAPHALGRLAQPKE